MIELIHGLIVTMNKQCEIIQDGYLRIVDNQIVDIGSMEYFMQRSQVVIHLNGDIVMPGMINLHTHLGMIPFRSFADDVANRLQDYLFPLEQACLTPELVYASSKVAMAELLLGGVTTVLDMYYEQEQVALACHEMNIRTLLGETIIEGGPTTARDALHKTRLFLEKYQKDSLITPIVAIHAPYSVDEQTLKIANDLSNQYHTLFTMHVNEMTYEVESIRKTHHMSVVSYLESLGLLHNRFLAAHMILTEPNDFLVLQRHDVRCIHNPTANIKSAKGIAPIYEMIQANILVGIGSDGPISGNTLDLFRQLPLVAMLQKTKYQDRTIMKAKKVIEMATIDAATIIHQQDRIGSLEVGKLADFIVLDTSMIQLFPIHDVYSTIVYGASVAHVKVVYVNGVCVVKEHQLVDHSIELLKRELLSYMSKFNTMIQTMTEA